MTWTVSSAGRASAWRAGGHRFESCTVHHIDWPILLSANFLLLYRQNMTFWSLLNAVFFRYCHHRCQAVLAGISTQNRPSGSPIPGVWRPFFGFGRKNRCRSMENFPAGFCWFCRFSDKRSKSIKISIAHRHSQPGIWHWLHCWMPGFFRLFS